MTNLSLDNFNRMWIGFDHLHNQINNLNRINSVEYPRYNITQDGDKYTIEIGLPGWKREDINISHSIQDEVLLVVGTKPKDERNFVHRGMSGKGFSRDFKVGEHIEVVDAKMEDGMLVISLETRVPDELQPRVIDVQ